MGDLIGGERPLAPARLRSPVLRALGREAAAHCVRRCYETWPELADRYGARGRQHAARDASWHLEHLDEAVATGEPRLFADYADWLVGLLAARAIGREQVAGAFGFLAEAIEGARCPASREDHRQTLITILRDNQARLGGGVPGVPAGGAPGVGPGVPAVGEPTVGISGTPPHLAYFERLMELDREGAVARAEAYLGDCGDPLDVYVDLLEPALVHTGREWEGGRISVAHEHYVSEVTRDLVHRYGQRIRSEAAEGAPVAVTCCVPRERHGIGLMMVTDALRAGGLEVHPLGEALTADAVVAFAAQAHADLLGLSCAMDVHLREAADLIDRARQALPGLKVAVGGAALRGRGETVRAGLGADWTASDVREVRRVLPDWLAALRQSPSP